eukprot:TRINITY_DN27646_c0_g1_i1.p1 TRINITY_DN27646_c0_g1~~TRINITY_DN27646_c0_g1_i1.p1  ORF type:complete len:158 (+),score=34.91 TRINITY_DN27646_c0_g1_i1:209-682(+)
MCCIMKCADLSNEIRPSSIADRWAERVNKEFSAQAELEYQLMLPPAPKLGPIELEQIKFIKGLCLPLYQTLQQVFTPVTICVNQMQKNLLNWEERYLQVDKTDDVSSGEHSVFHEEQQKGTGRSLVDHLSALASVAGFGLGLRKRKRIEKQQSSNSA